MKTRTRKGDSLSLPYSVLLGSFFSIASLIICALLGSAILMLFENPTGNIKLASLIILLISGAVCGFSISASRKNGGILSAVFSSAICALLIITVGIIMGGVGASGGVFMNALCYMLVCALFAYLGRRRERKRKR